MLWGGVDVHLSQKCVQLEHYALDHNRSVGARSKHTFPGTEDELGRGAAGMPLLQDTRVLATNGEIE